MCIRIDSPAQARTANGAAGHRLKRLQCVCLFTLVTHCSGKCIGPQQACCPAPPCISEGDAQHAPNPSVPAGRKVILMLHIAKTGGSSINELCHQQQALFMGYAGRAFPPICFAWMYRTALPVHVQHRLQLHSAVPPAVCKNVIDAAIKQPTRPMAVEFHARYMPLFFDLAPHFPALRAHFAQAGGRLMTATLLREPRSLLVSTYGMWPPLIRIYNASGHGGAVVNRSVLPLEGWLNILLNKSVPRQHKLYVRPIVYLSFLSRRLACLSF